MHNLESFLNDNNTQNGLMISEPKSSLEVPTGSVHPAASMKGIPEDDPKVNEMLAVLAKHRTNFNWYDEITCSMNDINIPYTIDFLPSQ